MLDIISKSSGARGCEKALSKRVGRGASAGGKHWAAVEVVGRAR